MSKLVLVFGTMYGGKSSYVYTEVQPRLFKGDKGIIIKPHTSERENEKLRKSNDGEISLSLHSGLMITNGSHENLTLIDCSTRDEFQKNGYLSLDSKINPIKKFEFVWFDEFHFIEKNLGQRLIQTFRSFGLDIYISMLSNLTTGPVDSLDYLVNDATKIKKKLAICQNCNRQKGLYHCLTEEFDDIMKKNNIPKKSISKIDQQSVLNPGTKKMYIVVCYSCHAMFKHVKFLGELNPTKTEEE